MSTTPGPIINSAVMLLIPAARPDEFEVEGFEDLNICFKKPATFPRPPGFLVSGKEYRSGDPGLRAFVRDIVFKVLSEKIRIYRSLAGYESR